jgi:hypothetical protein
MKINFRKISKLLLVTVALLAASLYFFRYIVLSNFDLMLGDSVDARLIMLICEHWYHVFQGSEIVRNLIAFYPQENTLGYSDTLFAFSIPYSLFRVIGLDMFRSMQFVLFLFHFIGGASLFVLLKFKLKRSFWASLIGAVMFLLANNYFVKSLHPQMLMIGLVPFLFIFIHGFLDNLFLSSKKRIAYGLLAIFLTGLMFFSGFYIAYFTVLFLGTSFVIWLLYSLFIKEKPVLAIINFIKIHPFEIIMYFMAFVVFLLPTLWVYLPVANMQGPRSFAEVTLMLPHWFDFFNVSSYNLIWGKSLLLLLPKIETRPLFWELMTGFPFVTLLLFFSCIFYFIKKILCKDLDRRLHLPFIFGIGIVVSMLLIVSFFGLSLWWFVYKIIPGANVIRGVSRYGMFLSLPLVMVLTYGVDIIIVNWRKVGLVKPFLISTVLVFLILENTMVMDNARWGIAQQRNGLTEIISPPENCEVFVILNPIKTSDPRVENYQLDAWIIATKYNLNTINGYSGNIPVGWNNLIDPSSLINYKNGIKEWSNKNSISNLCAYDQKNNKWIPDILL